MREQHSQGQAAIMGVVQVGVDGSVTRTGVGYCGEGEGRFKNTLAKHISTQGPWAEQVTVKSPLHVLQSDCGQ